MEQHSFIHLRVWLGKCKMTFSVCFSDPRNWEKHLFQIIEGLAFIQSQAASHKCLCANLPIDIKMYCLWGRQIVSCIPGSRYATVMTLQNDDRNDHTSCMLWRLEILWRLFPATKDDGQSCHGDRGLLGMLYWRDGCEIVKNKGIEEFWWNYGGTLHQMWVQTPISMLSTETASSHCANLSGQFQEFFALIQCL